MNTTDTNLRAPIMGISRFRFETDGEGVTTLVGFKGCPNRCKYCLNPKCFEAEEPGEMMTPRELYEKIKDDEFYYIVTDGGVCFGGGEPLLYSDFIVAFAKLRESDFRITIETSLNVPLPALQKVLPYVSEIIVDIKDMDGDIYRRYTGQSNDFLHANLRYLRNESLQSIVKVRLPKIKGFNSDISIGDSEVLLRMMRFERIEHFEYIIPEDIDYHENEDQRAYIDTIPEYRKITTGILPGMRKAIKAWLRSPLEGALEE